MIEQFQAVDLPVSSELLVNLFQSPLHHILTAFDFINLSHQRVLHPIIHHVNTLTSLPKKVQKHDLFRKYNTEFESYLYIINLSDQHLKVVCYEFCNKN